MIAKAKARIEKTVTLDLTYEEANALNKVGMYGGANIAKHLFDYCHLDKIQVQSLTSFFEECRHLHVILNKFQQMEEILAQ